MNATATEARPTWLPSWVAGDIVRHDAEYAVERGPAGNYFLFYLRGPADVVCVGGADEDIHGAWHATVNKPYDPETDSDARLVAIGNEGGAVQLLWESRHSAWSGE